MARLTPACALCLLPSSCPDIKRLYRQTGVELKPTSFLFVDTQIADESFLEDINNILSSGEVPNLYKADEFEEVQAPPPSSTSGYAPLTTPPSDRCHRGPAPWGSALQPQPRKPSQHGFCVDPDAHRGAGQGGAGVPVLRQPLRLPH